MRGGVGGHARILPSNGAVPSPVHAAESSTPWKSPGRHGRQARDADIRARSVVIGPCRSPAVDNVESSTIVCTGRTGNSHRCPLPFHNGTPVGLPLVPVVVRCADDEAAWFGGWPSWGRTSRVNGVGHDPEPAHRITRRDDRIEPPHRTATDAVIARVADVDGAGSARDRFGPRCDRERARRGWSGSCFARVRAKR